MLQSPMSISFWVKCKIPNEKVLKSFGQAIKQCQLLKTLNKQKCYQVLNEFCRTPSTSCLPMACLARFSFCALSLIWFYFFEHPNMSEKYLF